MTCIKCVRQEVLYYDNLLILLLLFILSCLNSYLELTNLPFADFFKMVETKSSPHSQYEYCHQPGAAEQMQHIEVKEFSNVKKKKVLQFEKSKIEPPVKNFSRDIVKHRYSSCV